MLAVLCTCKNMASVCIMLGNSLRLPTWKCCNGVLVCCTAGVDIMSAIPPTDFNFFRNYDIFSGGFMSAAHVAGMAALLRQKYPAWSPAAIKSAMVTTGRTTDANGGNLGGPRSSGGGEVGDGC
eukprot:GHRQ01020916.1.p1 GENE.GHRQ01020916.1~~GHRQ01020916.1.p1  ORF type:complete len:124 (+),score=22.84 GHRQ01020916.1:537-908(+)